MPLKPSFVATSKKTCPFLVNKKASTSITGQGALPSVLPGAAQLNHWHYTPRENPRGAFSSAGLQDPFRPPPRGGGSGLPAARNRKGCHPERRRSRSRRILSRDEGVPFFCFRFSPSPVSFTDILPRWGKNKSVRRIRGLVRIRRTDSCFQTFYRRAGTSRRPYA